GLDLRPSIGVLGQEVGLGIGELRHRQRPVRGVFGLTSFHSLTTPVANLSFPPNRSIALTRGGTAGRKRPAPGFSAGLPHSKGRPMDDLLSAASLESGHQTRRLGLLLLWLAGIDLRLTILAVPPLLPLIHRDLALDEKSVAVLSGLPLLLFGIMAVPGSLLIARIGARRALITGLLIVALASGLRGAGASAAVLFPMTFAMGGGVSIMQPALPALVSR